MTAMARIKKMVSLAFDPALLARLDKWMALQDVPPSKTAVHEVALREFLDKRMPESAKPEKPKGKRG